MKVAILSRNPDLYSTRRLVEACESRGHEAHVLDTLRFSLLVESTGTRLFYDERAVSGYDVVIPRIGASITMRGALVVRQFAQQGVITQNEASAILLSRDKLGSILALAHCGVPVPSTAFAAGSEAVMHAIEHVGGAPVIVKLLEGTQGVGVILAESANTAEAIVETLRSKRQNALIQRFVKESRGRDIRALVVAGTVVAAVRRIARVGEFRSNIHRGGRAEPLTLDPEQERVALDAARVLGLDVAGVDLLESDAGPLVAEVNSSPGLEGIECATGVDAAGEMIAELERRAGWTITASGGSDLEHFRQARG